MTPAQLIARFDELDKQAAKLPASSSFESDSWAVQAHAALQSVFKEHEAPLVAWRECQLGYQDRRAGPYHGMLRPIFAGAAEMVRKGYLGSLVDAVRIETLGDLLDHAAALLEMNYTAAATVLAGGALETHLRRLCERHSIAFRADAKGDGALGAYNEAISQARNLKTIEVYGPGDTKQITAWADDRNKAAHKPVEFTKTREEVSIMIQGIRLFLTRVP